MSKYYHGYGNYSSGYNYSKNRPIGYYNSYDDDDYYYNRSSYYKPKTTWSWSNWGDDEVEDAGDLFIKDSESYFTPTKRDLHYRVHGSQIQDCQELCRFFYHKMVMDKEYIAEKYRDESKLSSEELDIVNSKKVVYEKLWTTDIPGISPKEKAIYLLSQMKGVRGNDLRIEDLKEETIESYKIHHDDYWDPIYNELLDELKCSREMEKTSILRKLSMIRNFGSKFKVEKDIEEKVVANSHIHARKMMRDFSQVYNVELYQRMFPNFNHKLATKDLLVHVPVDKTEHKQKIIMLVDYSGSMNCTFKQEWVVAILLERLKYVIKEECEIYFSYFLEGLYGEFKHIRDRESALDFWRKFSTRPTGGDTNLGGCIDAIGKNIKENRIGKHKIDPSENMIEVLAIGDGQDTVKTSAFTWKTNAVSLVQDNAELKRLCKKNNGIHVFIDEGNHVNIRE